MLDDRDEFVRTKFEVGEIVRYVGCPESCDCKCLPDDLKAFLNQCLPGSLHFGREGPVEMIAAVICKMTVAPGASIIAHVDHFEAADVR